MKPLKVILFGTGGYGESVLISIDEKTWIVVDSCIDPNTNEPVPLAYLRDHGVNLKEDVKLVICSHWHGDHIQGMDVLLDACESAKFGCAIATDKEKFLNFIEFDSREAKKIAGTSSTEVFESCLSILMKRKTPLIQITQDRLLYSLSADGVKAEVYALSPSDKVLEEFEKELSLLMSESQTNQKIVVRKPNDKSVVLLVSANGHHILLGGDLETHKDNERGWLCILDHSECFKNKKFSLVKIAHHGSANGYEERLFRESSEKDSVGLLSPFVNGDVTLPDKTMLETYYQQTGELYITSDIVGLTSKKRDKSLSKAIQALNPTLREIKYQFGYTESVIDLEDPKAKWHTEIYQSARRVNQKYINAL